MSAKSLRDLIDGHAREASYQEALKIGREWQKQHPDLKGFLFTAVPEKVGDYEGCWFNTYLIFGSTPEDKVVHLDDFGTDQGEDYSGYFEDIASTISVNETLGGWRPFVVVLL